MSRDVVILSACRIATGRFFGSFSGIPASQLGGVVVAEAVNRAGVRATDIDEVILGNVLQAGQGQNPARLAMLAAGLPEEVPAITLNKLCGSAMKAVPVPQKKGEPILFDTEEQVRADATMERARTNICGGAIALGHPVGATGARILTTLIHALGRTNGRYGLATMCIGGGQGIATIVEAE